MSGFSHASRSTDRRRAPFALSTATMLVALGALTVGAHDARGAEAPPATAARVVTLPEALAYAHAHQPAIRAALAAVDVFRAEARVPRAQWEPVVGATAQVFAATENNTTASYLGTSDVVLPRVGGGRDVATSSSTWKPYGSTLLAASLTQEVFDFGRIAAATAAADARIEIGKHGAEAERLDVDLAVEEAYFGVYAAKGVLAASREAFTRTREHRDLAKAGVGSGLRSPIELTRAEADLSRFEIGVVRAEGALEVAAVALAASMGTPEVAFDVSTDAPLPRDLPSLADALRLASARDPRLAEMIARVRAQERTTRAISATLRPNLLASGALYGVAGGGPPSGNGVTPTGAGFLPDVPNWDVGLVLSWPLFDGVVIAEREASRASERARSEEVAVYRERQAAAIQQAYTVVATAKRALPALESARVGAVANYRQADARFRAGLGNAVELADAEELRASAEIQLSLGLFAVARARAAFGRVIAEGLST